METPPWAGHVWVALRPEALSSYLPLTFSSYTSFLGQWGLALSAPHDALPAVTKEHYTMYIQCIQHFLDLNSGPKTG